MPIRYPFPGVYKTSLFRLCPSVQFNELSLCRYIYSVLLQLTDTEGVSWSWALALCCMSSFFCVLHRHRYSKSIVSLVALLISFTTGVSWITQVLGMLFFKDIIPAYCRGHQRCIVHNIFCPWHNSPSDSAVVRVGSTRIKSYNCSGNRTDYFPTRTIKLFNLLTIIGKSVFTFIIPYAFNYFPPFPYILLSLFQPLLLIYLYRF
jgi:hypothetical protein